MIGLELLPDLGSTESVIKYFATIGVQAVVFLLVLSVLNFFVLFPLRRVLELRKRKIDDVARGAEELLAKNDLLNEEYKWKMDGARQLADEKREMTKQAGERSAEMLLAEVRRETNRDIDSVIREEEGAYEVTMPAMKNKIETFAEDIRDRILSH